MTDRTSIGWPKRMAVLAPTLGILAGLGGLWCIPGLPESSTAVYRLEMWGIIMAGPCVMMGYSLHAPTALGMAAISLPAMAAHPLWPGIGTGVLTVIGLLVWFFAGWSTALVMCYGA